MANELFDIGIIGCGPAGLSAAISAKSKNRDIVVLGSEICSPPLHKAPMISNYLGFPATTGEELRQAFLGHASAMGVDILKTKADAIYPDGSEFMISSGGDMLRVRTVIICTGIPYRASLQNETRFLGKGLGYCATCDGPLYRDRKVALIAHNPEGEPEANYLAEICSEVYYVPLYRDIQSLDPRVKVVREKPKAVEGDTVVRSLTVGNEQIPVDGVFIVGAEAAPDRLLPGLEMDDIHIKVNRKMETNIPGVFAAGDCCGAPYQLAKAVGEGQVAGLNASKLVLKQKK